MIKQKFFAYHCTGFWLEKDENGNEIQGTEIVSTKGLEDKDYYQLRLMGYIEPYGKVSTFKLRQAGLKSRPLYTLINGFSICGKREQLEYMREYIKYSLENSVETIYKHPCVRLVFRNCFYNISYFLGKRSVYVYKFDFGMQEWVDFLKYANCYDEKKFNALADTFIKIRNDEKNVAERERSEETKKRNLEIIRERNLERELESFKIENDRCDLDMVINDFVESIVNSEASEIEKYNQQRKLDLSQLEELDL